jgi:hypothetical protein
MLDGLQTVAILLVAQIVGAVIMREVFQREAHGMVQGAIDALGEIFEKPLVKGSMTVLGKKSGEKRHNAAMVDRIATDVLDSPKVKALKLGAKAFGIDVDAYIEEFGAVDTLQAFAGASELLPGFDLGSLLGGNGAGVVEPVNFGPNPYL